MLTNILLFPLNNMSLAYLCSSEYKNCICLVIKMEPFTYYFSLILLYYFIYIQEFDKSIIEASTSSASKRNQCSKKQSIGSFLSNSTRIEDIIKNEESMYSKSVFFTY